MGLMASKYISSIPQNQGGPTCCKCGYKYPNKIWYDDDYKMTDFECLFCACRSSGVILDVNINGVRVCDPSLR